MKSLPTQTLLIFTIIILGLISACITFISTFDLFEEPQIEILKTDCDDQGLREAIIYNYGGNAVTNSAIHVSIILGCNDQPSDPKMKIIFSAEHQVGASVTTEWKSLDTLKVIYSTRLQPLTQIHKVTYSDSTLNVIIEYVEN